MESTQAFQFNIVLFIVLFVGLPLVLSGQERQQFNGPYEVDHYKGEADFGYVVVDRDTLLDGPFLMQRSNLDALLKEKDQTFLFSGSFSNNVPVGNWSFLFGEYQSDRKTQIVGNQYRLNVSGTEHRANGNLDGGRPDGSWEYAVNRIKNSEVDQTFFKSHFDFDNGIPQKSFRIESDTGTLVGRFLRDGLAHDEWTFYGNNDLDATERWQFEDGVLQSIRIAKDGQEKVINLFPQRIKNPKIINLDARYLKVLQLTGQFDDFTEFEDGVYPILVENSRYYKKLDSIFSQLGDSRFMPEFKVKAPNYGWDDEMTQQLDSVRNLITVSDSISGSLLQDSHLALLLHSDGEAAYLYGAVQAISQELLAPLRQWASWYDLGVWEHIAPERMVPILWPEGLPTPEPAIDSIYTNGIPKTFKGPGAASVNFSGDNPNVIQEMAQYVHRGLDSIKNTLKDRLAKAKRKAEISEVEKHLVTLREQLNQIPDTLKTDGYSSVYTAIQALVQGADNDLETYGQLSDETEQARRARQLDSCFQKMVSLKETLAETPIRDTAIREAYQDRIWNPFTATLMDEEAKKRITSAYRKVLMPYILEGIRSETDCGRIGEWQLLMMESYERVLQLRDGDTAKMERKLRKEKDPLKVLELFNIKTEGIRK